MLPPEMLIIQRCNKDLCVPVHVILTSERKLCITVARCHFRDEITVNLCTIHKPFILNER